MRWQSTDILKVAEAPGTYGKSKNSPIISTIKVVDINGKKVKIS